MKRQKWLLFVGLLFLACGLTACGGDKSSTAASSNSDKTISIMAPYMTAEPPSKDNKLINEIEKKTKTKLDITWVGDPSYPDKMNVTLASGNLPEIMVIKAKDASFIKSAQAGTFWELSKYLKDYPNLAKADKQILDNSAVNGKIYGVYRRRPISRVSVTLRKDWLKKLGLKEPETMDDIANIAKAFTEKDPDGNGKNDTYGLLLDTPKSLGSGGTFDILSTWLGGPNFYGEKADGSLYPDFSTQEYFDGMKWMKDLIDKGYVNSDFATMSDNPINYYMQGKGGIIIENTYETEKLFTISDKKTLDKIYAFTGNMKGSDGKLRTAATDGYAGFLAIPKSSVKTEKDLRRILKFIDKTCDKNIQNLLMDGIEGANYKVDSSGKYACTINPDDNDTKKINNDRRNTTQLATDVQADEFYEILPDEGLRPLLDRRKEIIKNDTEHAVYNAAAPYVSEAYSSKGVTLDNIILDARLKYLSGQIDEKGWQNAVKQWYKTGGQKVVKELSKLNQESK